MPTKKAMGTVTATVEGSSNISSWQTLKRLTPYSMTRSLMTKREFIIRKKVKMKKLINDTMDTSLIILLLRIFILILFLFLSGSARMKDGAPAEALAKEGYFNPSK